MASWKTCGVGVATVRGLRPRRRPRADLLLDLSHDPTEPAREVRKLPTTLLSLQHPCGSSTPCPALIQEAKEKSGMRMVPLSILSSKIGAEATILSRFLVITPTVEQVGSVDSISISSDD
jgi:hypothetical protein